MSQFRVGSDYISEANFMAQSTFERYGGFASVSKLVTAFYDKVLDEPDLAKYFENTDMRRQIDHQTKFIASLMGGPVSYSNEELERVHSRYKIDKASFDQVLDLLQEALEDFDIEEDDINSIVQNFKSRSRFVINN
jgi:hemoglobin